MNKSLSQLKAMKQKTIILQSETDV